MAASASLLDDVHTQKVLEIWEALEATVGVKGVAISPLPHFSYMAARDFDLDTLQEVVAEVASKARPLMVRTAGVGIFTGEHPVVYLPVVRSPELAQLQLALWSAGALAAEKPLPEYHPAAWIPHVTLAQGDVTHDNVLGVLGILNKMVLDWEFEVDNLSIGRGRGTEPQKLVARYELGGTARNF